MRWRTWWLGAMTLIAACDAPDYHLAVRYHVYDTNRLDFYVDGQRVVVTGTAASLWFELERSYASYDDARAAPPIVVDAVRDGAVIWSTSLPPAVCDWSPTECEMIVAAEYSRCFDGDGASGGLCGSLSCYDEGGVCGGWIAGPSAQDHREQGRGEHRAVAE